MAPPPQLDAQVLDLTCDTAWRVLSGRVDLFAIHSGLAEGRRRRLFSVSGGEVVVGLGEGLPDSPVRVIAACPLDTRCDALARPLDPALRDGWALSVQALWTTGGGGRVLRTGPGVWELQAGQRVGGEEGPAWLQVRSGALKLGGQRLTAQDPPLFWTSGAWAEALDASDILVSAEPPADADGLEGLHRLALRAIAARLEAEAVRTSERWREGDRQEGKALARGLTRIAAAVLPNPGSAMEVPDAQDGVAAALDPLLRSLGRTSTAGMTVSAPGDDGALAEMLERAQVRSRPVLLRPGWRNATAGPLLGFLGEDRTPIALLPGRRWRAVGAGVDMAVDDALLAQLNPDALSLYRTLPAGTSGLGALLRLGAGGSGADLGRAVALAAAGALTALAVPLALQQVFNGLAPSGDRGGLAALMLVLFAVAIGEAAFQVGAAIAVLRIEQRFETRAAPALLDRLLRLPAGFFRDLGAGDLADRVLGLQSARRAAGASLTTVGLGAFFALTSAALLLGLDLRLGGAAILLSAAIAGVNLALQRVQVRRAADLALKLGRLSSLLLELIGGMTKLRDAAAERRAMVRWSEPFAEALRRSVGVRRFASMQGALDGFLPLLASALMFGFIAGGRSPTLASSEVVAFAAAFGQLVGALVLTAQAASQVIMAVPVLDRLKPILTVEPEGHRAAGAPGLLEGAVALRNVSFRYAAEGAMILDDVSLDIPAGGFVAVVGTSGSGKSTLLRTLLGFEKPLRGQVLFDGRPADELDPVLLRRQIGVVLQNGRLSSGSILENILGPAALSISDAWEAARAVGLAQDIEAMPMGMHTVLLDGAGTLSGGQSQRLMIARALVHKPRILMFDEATSALDNRSQAIVTQTLRSFSITRVVIAHRLSTIAGVDKVFVMDKGRLVQSGGYRDLLETPGPFADLARRQLVE